MRPNADEAIDRIREIACSEGDRTARARSIAELIRAAGEYRWVGLYDVGRSIIAAIAWTGSKAPSHPTFPVNQGLNGAAVTACAPVVVQDVRNDSRYLTTFGSTLAEAIFPVRSPKGQVLGTIDVESDRANAFSAEDEAFLRRCTTVIAGLWD
jgi:GAF domain-containing protein